MFEFARIVVWMHLLSAATNFSYIIIVLGSLATITMSILWGVGKGKWFDNYHNTNHHLNELVPKLMAKLLKTIIPILAFFIVFAIFVPAPKKVIAYLSLKQVDNYNVENVGSMYNPQEVLGVVDETLQKAKEFLESQ